MNLQTIIIIVKGVVNTEGRNAIDDVAQQCSKAVAEGRWADATSLWGDTEVAVLIEGHNILYKTQPFLSQEILDIKDPKSKLYHCLEDYLRH
jgi:hypothetical protein